MAPLEKRLEPYVLLLSLLFLTISYSASRGGDDERTQPAYYQLEEAILESEMRRGINIGNALEAPREGEWGVYIRDE